MPAIEAPTSTAIRIFSERHSLAEASQNAGFIIALAGWTSCPVCRRTAGTGSHSGGGRRDGMTTPGAEAERPNRAVLPPIPAGTKIVLIMSFFFQYPPDTHFVSRIRTVDAPYRPRSPRSLDFGLWTLNLRLGVDVNFIRHPQDLRRTSVVRRCDAAGESGGPDWISRAERGGQNNRSEEQT